MYRLKFGTLFKHSLSKNNRVNLLCARRLLLTGIKPQTYQWIYWLLLPQRNYIGYIDLNQGQVVNLSCFFERQTQVSLPKEPAKISAICGWDDLYLFLPTPPPKNKTCLWASYHQTSRIWVDLAPLPSNDGGKKHSNHEKLY